MEIMAGHHRFHALFPGCRNNRFYGLIPCKEFRIHQINQTGLHHVLIQFYIILCVRFFFSAFSLRAECKKERHLSQYVSQFSERFLHFPGIKNILIPVCAPLCHMGLCFFYSGSCFQYRVFCPTYNRNTYFRHTRADLHISYFNRIHIFPFRYK